MGAIKNVGQGPVAAIIEERETSGPFTSFIDFCERVSMKSINKRTIESLVKVGAFDSFEKMNRKTLLENLEQIVAYAQKKQDEQSRGQANLFDMDGAFTETKEEMLDVNQVEDFDDKEKLSYEQQLLGIYVSGHPLEKYGEVLKELVSMPIKEINELPKMAKPEFDFRNRGAQKFDPSKRNLTIAGIISEKKAILTKKGDRMAFVTMEDLSGKIECIFFPKTYNEYFEFLEGDDPIVIEGYVKLSEDRRSFFVNKVRKIEDETDNRVSAVRITVDTNTLHDHSLGKLKNVLLSYRGAVPAHIIFESKDGRAQMDLGENFLVNPIPQMAAKINEVLNNNSVSFIVDGNQVEKI